MLGGLGAGGFDFLGRLGGGSRVRLVLAGYGLLGCCCFGAGGFGLMPLLVVIGVFVFGLVLDLVVVDGVEVYMGCGVVG